MRAIVLPLNELFYNFEKYDGSTSGERFNRKHPTYIKFVNSKFGGRIIKYCVAIPIGIALIVLFAAPVYFFFILRYGYARAKSRMHAGMDKWVSISENKRKNILPIIRKFRTDGHAVFVYYTSEMIPKKEKQKKMFFKKLLLMKRKLNISHLQLADTKEDIETLIWLFDIDRVEYFLMKMQLEISSPELLIPLGSTQEIFDEREMVAGLEYPVREY